MDSRKMVLMNLFARQQWRNRQNTLGKGEEGEGEMHGESNLETYINICEVDSQVGICCMSPETQTGAL